MDDIVKVLTTGIAERRVAAESHLAEAERLFDLADTAKREADQLEAALRILTGGMSLPAPKPMPDVPDVQRPVMGFESIRQVMSAGGEWKAEDLQPHLTCPSLQRLREAIAKMASKGIIYRTAPGTYSIHPVTRLRKGTESSQSTEATGVPSMSLA